MSFNVGSAIFWLSFSVVAVQRESCSLAAPRVAALIHACSSFLAIAVIGARPVPVEVFATASSQTTESCSVDESLVEETEAPE